MKKKENSALSLSPSLSLSLSLSFSLLSLSFDFRIGINLIKIDIYFLGPHGAPTNTLKKKKFKFEVYSLLFCLKQIVLCMNAIKQLAVYS